jgi:hypothetical protein
MGRTGFSVSAFFRMIGVDVKPLGSVWTLESMTLTRHSKNGNSHEEHGEKFHRAASYPVATERQSRV